MTKKCKNIPLKRKFVLLSVDISNFQNEKNLEAAIERILEKQESRNAYKMAIAMEIVKELLESIEIIQYNG